MTSKNDVIIEESIKNSDFCSNVAAKSLRITCYGSSSAKTPEKYLKEARSLGYILAKRGHVCVNGAGSYGCMAAMNDGAVAGNGHIIGVIHEMFLVDGGYDNWGGKKIDRDGSAHSAFDAAFDGSSNPRKGPIREILVAGGDDLQQRKKLLVKNADALVVLPGGPGTWDELWEMACARHLGLVKLPIVCVNVDGFYEPFKMMLNKAYEDKLIKLKPEEIVHFAPTPAAAIEWVENGPKSEVPSIKRLASTLKRSSFYSEKRGSFYSAVTGGDGSGGSSLSPWFRVGLTFAAGVAFGVGIAINRR